MKTILVATDFSHIADNAARYAAELAKLAHARMILFHVYHPPAVITEVPVLIPLSQLEADAQESLSALAEDLRRGNGSELEIDCICQFGFPLEEINRFTAENEVDLIVMGMKGAGYLSQRIIGSTTTSLIYKANCPVLVIDEHVTFKNIQEIVLSYDYENPCSQSALEPLEKMAVLFGAHISVLHVVEENVLALVEEKTREKHLLQTAIKDLPHSFHYTTNYSVKEGISTFLKENPTDMLVMIPGVHSAIENLFHEPRTKHMAFHTEIPLLALHN